MTTESVIESEPIKSSPENSGMLRLLMCALSGAVSGVCFSTLHAGWALWVTLIPFFFFFYLKPLSKRAGFLYGLTFGMSYYLGMMTWLFCLYPFDWLGMSNGLSAALIGSAWVGFSLLEALALGFLGLLLAWMAPQGAWRIITPMLLWVVMETIQGRGILGFTWGSLAVSQWENLAGIQILSITGSYAMTALLIASNAAIACVLLDRDQLNMARLRPVALVALLIVSVHGYGAWRLQAGLGIEAPSFKVSLIQGNFLSDVKWRDDALTQMIGTYSWLTRQAAKLDRPQLIVWPESAMPLFLREHGWLQDELRQVVKDSQATLLTGTLDRDLANEHLHNAAVTIDAEHGITNWYFKRHLVPFGEFIPASDFLNAITFGAVAKINKMGRDYSPGESAALFDLPFARIGTLICFESIFSPVVNDSVRAGANVLLVITNDSWYKDSIAPIQHNAQAVLRAVETDRYVLRAANTGVSSVIDPRGNILGQTPLLQTLFLTGEASPRETITPFVRWGDWFSWLAALGCMLLGLRRWRNGNHSA